VLLSAATQFRPDAQVVLLAGPAETPELGAEVDALLGQLRAARTGVFWISEMLARASVIQLLSHAAVFVCPSVYEPLGIVNLEAMACETAVVASAVGGIPEVVIDGETGLLVAYDPDDPASFESGLATAIGSLLDDPERARGLGAAGRARAVAEFGWAAVARRTAEIYRALS
jgi:alpha-maltose-1-phosphate synthase